MENPYILADTRQRTARRRRGGVTHRLEPLLPLVAGAVAVWFADDLYDTILGPGPELRAGGFETLVSRIGLLIAAALSLSTYDVVIRPSDRAVLDVHPLLPSPWLHAALRRVASTRLPWLLLGWIALTPLWPHAWAFLAGGAAVTFAWAAGIGVGLGVNLAAPALGTDPRFAGILNAIRGANPRLQAALLYAPGVALAVSGGAALAGAWGAARLVAGDPAGALGLTAPLAVSIVGWVAARANAPAAAGVGVVLGEIEAAWATVEEAQESRLVYLEWAVRFAPGAMRVAMLKELRHLWRGQRVWVTASWVLALLTGITGWTSASSGAGRLLSAGAAALALVGLVGVRLGAKDPPWLDTVLEIPRRRTSRAIVVLLALQPIILTGATTLAIRQGLTALPVVVRLEAVGLTLAIAGAILGHALRSRGTLVYGPLALVVWAIGATA